MGCLVVSCRFIKWVWYERASSSVLSSLCISQSFIKQNFSLLLFPWYLALIYISSNFTFEYRKGLETESEKKKTLSCRQDLHLRNYYIYKTMHSKVFTAETKCSTMTCCLVSVTSCLHDSVQRCKLKGKEIVQWVIHSDQLPKKLLYLYLVPFESIVLSLAQTSMSTKLYVGYGWFP